MTTSRTSLHYSFCLLLALSVVISACRKTTDTGASAREKASGEPGVPAEPSALAYVAQGEVYNPEAPIPSQCYTKTDGVHNPCYVCHQTYGDKSRSNMMNDGFQQGSYAFSEQGEANSWKNLFKDRTRELATISDDFIRSYIAVDNYAPLVTWMKSDAWQGEVLELQGLSAGRLAFDEFGLARDGSRWVAFNYKPFPSTFWPTNGSTDDTMIRLPVAFSARRGEYSRDVYYANLSLLEIAIKGLKSLDTPPLDETIVGADLDADGKLEKSVPTIVRRSNYVGDAREVELAHMLYPQGTEFLHTVRYIGVDSEGRVHPAPRLKELRYMKKAKFFPRELLRSRYYDEAKDKHYEKLPRSVDRGEQGVSNSFGWLLLGFIEDEKGSLRKQHPEEQHFCVGCHKSIGSTIDQTFGFPRKVAGREGWRYLDLRRMKDVPNLGEVEGEYLTYFRRVGGGDEFRQNQEMLSKWFQDGVVDEEKVTAAASVYELIAPSAERALLLNKAYLVTVREQSFLFGRDVVAAPATNVVKQVQTEIAPLREEHRYAWDIRLEWSQALAPSRPEAILSPALPPKAL